MKALSLLPLLPAVVLFLTGCATRYEVKVDAFADAGVSTQESYVLLPGNANTAESDLQFREFSGLLHRALAGKGYRRVESIDQARVVMYLAYGIGDPQKHQEITSFPVMGQTGYTIYTDPKTGTVTHIPTFGITGFDITTFTSTSYTSFMLVEAYDMAHFRASGSRKQLWKLIAKSTSGSGDLRQVFPAMVSASEEYLARDVGRQVRVEIAEDDPRLLRLKGQPVAGQPRQE